MDYVLQLVCAFVATYGIAIIFNAPKSTLIPCGLVGMIGWLIYYAMIQQQVDSVTASFCGAFIISIVAHYQAFKHKTPMLIFVVGGIITLV
ncbi:MAG TPA: threonine/serine exporter family protein, partial [Candidatus Kurthia intestinigallinarum]|nr:threonine/serine exporter family protein [Candidatus Kurthia intestinigallinarum]